MPKIIPQDVRALLDDVHWLTDQHVDRCMSINELSKLLNVTPSVIRKAIRTHNIISPSQQRLREASNLRKYGVSNTGSLPSVRNKALATMTELYGGHVWSNSGTRQIRDRTCQELYGNSNVGLTEYARVKTKQTNMDRYGREHINQHHFPQHVFDKLTDREWMHNEHVELQKPLSLIGRELQVDMSTVMRHLHHHNIETKHFFSSVGEREVASFLREHGITVEQNVRTLINGEIDIWLPQYNIAIEYCGLYWHSDLFKSNNYHLDKLNKCTEVGIRLITLFEDEWTFNGDTTRHKILRNIIPTSDRVYARNTTIESVSLKEKNKFLDQHHIQKSGAGSINYGLYEMDQLVAVITFINKGDGVYELNRYATSKSVVGGFSKLLTHFKRNNDWCKIISFADMRWSVGSLYDNTGWTCEAILPPDYNWCKNGKRYHKFNFRHKYLDSKLSQYDPNLSENVNCKRDGYLKIYNCGLRRYAIYNS